MDPMPGGEATPELFSLLAALRLHPVEIVDALVRERLLEPIQELRGRVDLSFSGRNLTVNEDGTVEMSADDAKT